MRSSHNFAERRIALFDKSCMQKGYLPLAQYHPQDCLSRSPMPSVCHLVVHIYQFLALGNPLYYSFDCFFEIIFFFTLSGVD